MFLRLRDIRRVNVVNEPMHVNTKEVANSSIDVFAWKPSIHDQNVQDTARVGNLASLALPESFMSDAGDSEFEATQNEGAQQSSLVQEGAELLIDMAKAGTQAVMNGDEPMQAALQSGVKHVAKRAAGAFYRSIVERFAGSRGDCGDGDEDD